MIPEHGPRYWLLSSSALKCSCAYLWSLDHVPKRPWREPYLLHANFHIRPPAAPNGVIFDDLVFM